MVPKGACVSPDFEWLGTIDGGSTWVCKAICMPKLAAAYKQIEEVMGSKACDINLYQISVIMDE
jgi:hypothetical protein